MVGSVPTNIIVQGPTQSFIHFGFVTHMHVVPIDLFESKQTWFISKKTPLAIASAKSSSNIASKQLGFFNEKTMLHHVRKLYEHFHEFEGLVFCHNFSNQ
jgi:hypothetical protein